MVTLCPQSGRRERKAVTQLTFSFLFSVGLHIIGVPCLGCVFPLQPKLNTSTWACPEACLLGCPRLCQVDKNIIPHACQTGSPEAPQHPDFCDVSDLWPQDWTHHAEVRQLRIPPINPVLDFLRMAAILKPRGCHQEAPNQYNKHSCNSGNSQ